MRNPRFSYRPNCAACCQTDLTLTFVRRQKSGGVLLQGKLLTFDYGLDGEARFAPQRMNGTLRAYQRHRQAEDVLASPGEQDLTAHVDFTTIQQAGEASGLHTEALTSQMTFLTSIARRVWQGGTRFGGWTSRHSRQFQTLTHPEHLGRAFRVLVQSRDVEQNPCKV